MSPMEVNAREALEMRETPYGSVGVVHDRPPGVVDLERR
jgi:hypothetical protein